MDIFALLSQQEKNSGRPGEDEDGDADSAGPLPREDDNGDGDDDDGFETPMSTPRSLFSTPPRTPPRSTSHIDDRIRMRRFKLAMSPNLTPRSSSGGGGGGDLLSEPSENPPLHHRITDISFSSARGKEDEGDDEGWDDSNGSYPSSPNVTPNNSPRKSDLLSISPIQQRLDRAKTKRQQILEERVQNIDHKSKEKELQAIKRKEESTLTKIEKARTEESINQAKSKRQQILDERVQQIDVKSKLKEKEALKRKEDATLEIIEKARSELAKSPIVKERRDQQLALRVESLEATLESKNAQAQSRLEAHLFDKQQRACCKERKERAERRRKLISYEKRAKLLAALDARLERAALKTQQINEEKVIKAGEDISKAKQVARKVKAARVIQRAIRKRYGIESPDCGNLDLSQHAAAERLQHWFQWRAHVCKSRLFATEEADADGENAMPEAIKALEQLLELFALAPEANQTRRGSLTPPPFEGLSQKMMQPETLKMAMLVADSLRPIVEVSFGSSGGNASPRHPSSKASPKIDGRTLLSLSLIAVHPCEVLGEDFVKATSSEETNGDRSTRGTHLLASKSRALLQSLNKLQASISTGKVLNEPEVLDRVSSLCLQALTLFQWWKNMDMEQLLEGLSKQLEQSWVVYLTSSETLKYLTEVAGVGTTTNKRDDPLMSLRLRHEAGRSGSRSHIKRIRLSLNKLVGADEGKEVVKNTKMVALKEIDENATIKNLKEEIDEIFGGFGAIVKQPVLLIGKASEANASETKADDKGTGQNEASAMSMDLPDEIVCNKKLVHTILLTDPIDFGKLSWDGKNAQSSNDAPGEFMNSFLPQPVSNEQNDHTPRSMEGMSVRMAQSMRFAFFQQIVQDMEQGNYASVRELLNELHKKMRALLPSRKDLYSHLNDEQISSCSSMSDILGILIRSGYLLANYLESAARAPTTRELINCLETLNADRNDGGSRVIPYQIESEGMFAVASIAYILHKAELCQMDVSNYKLSQAAPLLHHVGHEYERKHFQQTFGEYGSSSIEELQQMLSSTWNWVRKMQRQADSENLTPQSNFEQRMDLVKGKGFVDGILFTRSQLVLPEFFSLDVEGINHIRSESRCCVIASALALHACNISKVGTSVLSSSAMSNEVNDARQMVSSVLRKKHFTQTELESNIIEAVGALTKAWAERDLSGEELKALQNHTLAVLHGGDPVLKLLDNRVQSFFRFACKWKSDATSSANTAPLEMKTGRPILKSDYSGPARTGIKSTKAEFLFAAKKEASRLGFTYFGSDLIEVGKEAHGIISLACTNYGRDILDRFFNVVWE